MGKIHTELQEFLAHVRGNVPVVVDVDGTEHEITGVNILHEHDENAGLADTVPHELWPVEGVGAQVKAVITTVPVSSSTRSS
jgi:hypothetical protein